ncbi:MAG: 4'-phosphopantetheinyl transferase superfamily protein [Rhodothermales bacterium]|nr:4'-phosphopantetheinyl transferase superfamily protein [Rhodothermales bacterium]
MELPEGLYLRMLTDDPAADVVMMPLLAPEEVALVETLHLEKRRRQYTLGRLALRQLLAEHLGADPARVPLVVAGDGAVDLADSAWRLSVAHSGDHAVAAVHRHGAVGVDIERVQPRHPGLPRFLLHPEERGLVEGPDPDDRLILVWTIKEAVLKAMRTGFRISPRTLRVQLDGPNGQASILVNDRMEWQARFTKHDEYYVSVAYPAVAHP